MIHRNRKVLLLRAAYLHARRADRIEGKLDKDDVKSVLRELRAAWMELPEAQALAEACDSYSPDRVV